MKLVYDYALNKAQDLKGLSNMVSFALKQILDGITKKLNFTDNFQCTIVNNVQFTNGVELGISHNLGVIPIGFLVISKSAVADIRDGPSLWTSERINLIANANVVADIIVLGG